MTKTFLQSLGKSQDTAMIGLACSNSHSTERKQNDLIAVLLWRVGEVWYRIGCDRFQYASRLDAVFTVGTCSLHLFHIPQPDLRHLLRHPVQTMDDQYSPEVLKSQRARYRSNLMALLSLSWVMMVNCVAVLPPISEPAEGILLTILTAFIVILFQTSKEYQAWLVWMQIYENRELALFLRSASINIMPLLAALYVPVVYLKGSMDWRAFSTLSMGGWTILSRLNASRCGSLVPNETRLALIVWLLVMSTVNDYMSGFS